MKLNSVKWQAERNNLGKDLRSPKYRERVSISKIRYDRNVEKNKLLKELAYD
jgi:hypothetical protein